GGQRPVVGDHGADVLPLDELHHEVALAVGLALVVNPDQVFVLELGTDTRLALEAGDGAGVVHTFGRENLQGNPAVQAGVLGQVNSPHPPLPDQVDERVTVDLEPGRAPGEQLLRLPECQQARMNGLAGDAAVDLDLVAHAFFGRDGVPAGFQAV